MIKVLMSSTTPVERDGITNVMLNLSRNISSKKYEIGFVIINEPENSLSSQLLSIGNEVTYIKREIYHPIRYIYQYAKACKGYDIVHVHGNSATMVLEMLAAKFAGVKIRVAHSHNTYCTSKIIDFLCRPIFYCLCNARLACGIEAGKWLFNIRDFNVINNGIETCKFMFCDNIRKDLRNKLGWNDCIVLGQIGNFLEAKNHRFMIELFDKLVNISSSYRLLLLGDGILKEDMVLYAKELGIDDKIVFAGSVSNVEEYLNAMDLFIMPSLNEGLPLTTIEAQANGLNCILSDRITQDVDLTGNVEFLPLNSQKEWINVITSKTKDDDRFEKSKNSIAHIKEKGYDTQSSVSMLEKLYDRITDI